MKKIEPVAAYIRVSTTEQKLHGLSLDAQKMKLIAYAKKHNMKIVEWYMDEGVSGRKLIRKRPELQRLIHDAQKGNFERIIFIKLDRFFRSVAEYHECMKQIAPVVWSTTEEEYDLTTANGRMLVNMKLTIAEMEADQTGERIRIVNEYKTATGQPLTGSQPFGWMIAKDETGRKKIVKDPDEAPILEDVLQYYLTYHSKKKCVVYLHSKYHISMLYEVFGKLLKNTMLYGAYRDNPNYCEAYIDKETFDKIQEINKRNCKENTRDNRVYIFSGIIRCPECGRALSGRVQVQKRNGGKYEYKRYRCPHNYQSGLCSFAKAVAESTVEKLMLKNIEQYIEDAKIRAIEIRDSEEAKVHKYDIDEINAEIERLNYSWQKGRIKTIEKYDEQYDELMEQLELAKQERNEVEIKDFEKIEAVLHEGWREIYKALDDEHKKAFWRGIISSIELEWTTDVKRITKVIFF
jgi:DNA invertase Pin-like site-specific DNA recombinase/flagellin-specific chaperone FliS